MWRMRGIFGGLCVMRKWRKQQQAETDTDRAGVSYLLKRSLPGEVVQRRGEELLFRQPIALHGVRGWGLVLERIIQVKRNVFRRVSARLGSAPSCLWKRAADVARAAQLSHVGVLQRRETSPRPVCLFS